MKRNPDGVNVGFDLSPNMAAFTERRVRREFPHGKMLLQAVDARHMPFRDASFDHVVSCYLYELLDHDDIHKTLREIRRVLRPGGRLTAILIGQNDPMFTEGYKVWLVPAFWGRLVSNRMPGWVEQAGFRIEKDRSTRQGFYPSRVLVAQR
jgi:ubiquinone/menaquinone biosynthesis C-methylase UbiE